MSETQSKEIKSSNDFRDDSVVDHPHRSRYQKVYNAFGFTKAYNFPLYFICAGALFGFCLSCLEYFNYDGIFAFAVAPGDWLYFSQGPFKVGMIMHLAGAIPAGLLVVFQFTPIIRRKFILFHRINGYTILLLLLVSNIGVAIIVRPPAGSSISWRTVIAILLFLTTFAALMGLYNIKRLQIDQHRAWMMRCAFYLGTAATVRIVIYSGAVIITRIGDFYTVWSCEKIDFTYRQFGVPDILALKYPQCLIANGTLNGQVVIQALYDLNAPESASASTTIVTGAGLWLCLLLHLVGLEIYLAFTPREAARLRQISYEKQLAAGFKNPGSAGFTIERWGDAHKWEPALPIEESRV